jgi:hypothetical protein
VSEEIEKARSEEEAAREELRDVEREARETLEKAEQLEDAETPKAEGRTE